MPPDIHEPDHPLEHWARERLWMAAGVVLVVAVAGAIYFLGVRSPIWFALSLSGGFLTVVIIAVLVVYKLTAGIRSRGRGKQRPYIPS